MSVASPGGPGQGPGRSGSPRARVGVLDRESGLLQVLARRLEAVGLEHRPLGPSTRPADLVGMRLVALVVDLTSAPGGFAFLAGVTAQLPALPVVVCSGPSSVAERVRGLRLGADDWLNKPCHPEELVARVQAAARRRHRSQATPERQALGAGELVISPDRFQAFVRGRGLELTRREFELIHVLAAGAGRVMTREDVYQRVWGFTMAHGDRSVDVFVRKLRHKLKQASPGWRYIHTHFGVGYRFEAEPHPAGACEPAAGDPALAAG